MSTPGAPTITTITPGNSSLSIAFTAGSGTITNYEYSTDNGSNWTARSPSSTTSPISITGLTNGTTYVVALRAVNDIGPSPASSSVSTSPVATIGGANAPTSVAATPNAAAVSVSWVAPISNGGSPITAYIIERSTDNISWGVLTLSQAASPYNNTSLVNGTLYYYRVRALNATGWGTASSVVSATPRGIPAAPTVGIITQGNTQLSIPFTAGSDNGGVITNYEYSTNNGTTYVARSPASTASPVVITGLTNGTAYSVRIRAINVAGNGTGSTTVSATPIAVAVVPLAPTVGTIVSGDTQLSVPFTLPATNGGSTITNCEYSIDGANWVTPSPASIVSPLVITGLTNGSSYPVRLRLVNTTGSGAASVSQTRIPGLVPDAPTSVAAIADPSGNAIITISWVAPVNNGGIAITAYKVERSIDNATWTTLTSSQAASPYNSNSLTNGTLYYYRVSATNTAGFGAVSSVVSATPGTIKSVPTGNLDLSGNPIIITFATGVIAPSATVINNSTIKYTNTSFNDVTITPTGSAWTITKNGTTDVLTQVRKIILSDKIIYLLGSGAAAASSAITTTPTTVGDYTMTNTNPGGVEYLWNYNVNALAEYNATGKEAIIYFAGDTIYAPSNAGTVLNNFSSPMSIIGKDVSGNKALLRRPDNANNIFLQLWTSNVRFENIILDFYTSSLDSISAMEIIGSNYNLNQIENITFKDVIMQRARQRGVQLYYVNNIMFDGCTFAKPSARAAIGISSGKNVTIKNCIIPKGGASQLNYGSIYINSANGPSAIYAGGQSLNTSRISWTDAEKFASLETLAINLSENNTFTDDLSTGKAIILIDPYRSANGNIQPGITYKGVNPNVILPAEFQYGFEKYYYDANSVAIPGLPTPNAYITKNSTDITGSLATWGINPTNVTVRNVSTDVRVYPVGYELSNTVFDPSTLTTETEIPLSIGGVRKVVPIRASNSLAGLSDLDPVFVTGVSANPKLVVFTSSDAGVAVKNSIDNSINAVCVQRVVKGSTISSIMDVNKRSAVSSVSVSKLINSQTQSATADITSLPSTYSVILNVNDIDSTGGLKASSYFKVIDSSGNIVSSDISVPIDFVIPGTESISSLDLYKYDTSLLDYVKLDLVNKKANTTTTFSYTFTTNSDYQMKVPLPVAPTNLDIVSGDSQLELDWVAPAGTITSYKVYRDGILIDTISDSPLSNVYVDSSVTTGQSYSYTVSAVNETGEGPQSASASGVPDGKAFAPANFIAVHANSSANLSWNASNANVGNILNYFIYYRKVTDLSYNKVDTQSIDVSYNLINLENGTSYNVYVVPVDQLGEGDGSSIQTVTPSTTADAPTIDQIVFGDESLSVQFTAPANDGGASISDYEYNLNNSVNWALANSTSSPIVISNLDNGTSYDVKLRAINLDGSGNESNMLSEIPRRIPDAPVITTIVSGDEFLTVNFTIANDGGNEVDYYQYSIDNGLQWVDASGVVSPITISSLVNGTPYTVKLRAHNNVGYSPASNGLSKYPYTIASAPTITNITFGDELLSVNFTGSLNNGGSPITNYEYSVDNGSNWTARSPNSTSSPIVISGLVNGTLYDVKLRAVNEANGGNESNVVSETPLAVPRAPTITGIITEDNLISIAFDAGNDGGTPITDYEYSIDNGSNWVSTNNQLASPLEISLLTNQIYSFIIRAINALGSGNQSNKVNSIACVGPTTYLLNPIIIAPTVSDAAGVSTFEVKVEDTKFTSNTGVGYAIDTGVAGAVGLFTINAFDVAGVPITNFSANPITVNINLPNANPLNTPLKMYKRVSYTSYTLMNPQPAGYPADVNYVSGDLWSTTLTSLSSYLIQDPAPPAGSAGGDPHLKQVDGTVLTIPNDWNYIRLYECEDIRVIGKAEFISDEVILGLHKKNHKNVIININKNKYRDRYVTNFTYFTELDFYKDNELCIKVDTINGKIIYNNDKMTIDNIRNSNKGIYSLTHNIHYEAKKYIEHCVHLHNGDYLEVGVDNFWDDINCLNIYLSKNNTNYKGEFFNHSIENLMSEDNQEINRSNLINYK